MLDMDAHKFVNKLKLGAWEWELDYNKTNLG